MGEGVTILLAALAAGGQILNVFLNLRIRTAILEQDKAQRVETDTRLKDYVQKATCDAWHHPANARY
jgi:hypothetical protein